MSRKKPFAVIDCETNPFKYGRIPAPFIWGFYDGTEYREFSDTADLAAHVAGFDGFVYAHNGGKFDFHFLTEYLNTYEKLQIISGRLAQAKLGDATLRDSYLILPTPLAAFSKQDFDYSLLEPENRASHMPEIRDYLRSDCINLYNYIAEFHSRFPRTLTLASCAFQTWRTMSGIDIPRTTPAFYDWFSPYYFGGRVQPMQIGIVTKPLVMVDINSAYPRAMTELHPWGDKFTTSKRVADSKLYKSFVTFEGANEGMLPKRGEKAGERLRYDVERGRFHCTGHEFATGLELGHIKPHRIIAVHQFEQAIDFHEYVGHFYDMKTRAEQEGDKNSRLFAKLFLNSLYGKMAANPENYSSWILGEYGDSIEGFTPDAMIGNRQLFRSPVDRDGPEARYYNIATAASVTGWVRAYLWRSICQTVDPIYCDTDSILCGDPGDLEVSDRLGDWSIEAEADKAAIGGRKLYALWHNGKPIKARSKGARLTAEEIEHVARGGTVTYKPEVPTFSITNGIGFINRKIQLTA